LYLVNGFNPSEKYEFVSWDDYSQHMESHQKFHGSSHHQPGINKVPFPTVNPPILWTPIPSHEVSPVVSTTRNPGDLDVLWMVLWMVLDVLWMDFLFSQKPL
jgi:hypothetical protein